MTSHANPWQHFGETLQQQGWLMLDELQLAQFQKLYQLVMEANKNVNITRITDESDFVTRHLLDSLSLIPQLKALPGDFRLIDIGSGAGFPALPLAMIYPKAKILAVESVQKKARLIEQFAADLGLANLTVEAERAEILGQSPKYREQFDIATARAVAAMNIQAELCLPFVKPGGRWIAMKTENTLEAELRAAETAIEELGGAVQDVLSPDLPDLSHHVLAIIEKMHSTPRQYPRKPGIPSKTPL